MNNCDKKTCIFYWLTMLANAALLVMSLWIYANSYGDQKYMALLLGLPPLLSVIALRKGGDKEERMLRKRIRKAKLRQELDGLKPFDHAEDKKAD